MAFCLFCRLDHWSNSWSDQLDHFSPVPSPILTPSKGFAGGWILLSVNDRKSHANVLVCVTRDIHRK